MTAYSSLVATLTRPTSAFTGESSIVVNVYAEQQIAIERLKLENAALATKVKLLQDDLDKTKLEATEAL